MKKLLILASMMFVLGGCSDSVGGNGDGPDDGKVSVAFALPGIGVETSAGGGSVASLGTRTGAAVPLDEDVTVRVVAYERKGTLAELSSDEYIDEATYVAVKEGDAIVLKPCSVSFDASTGRISAVSTTGASPLRLMAGTYDFYAITPALQLERDGSGKKPVAPAHTSVFHGDDFASSLTEGVEVLSSGSVRQPDPAAPGGSKTLTDGKVELSVLDRKCSRLVFSVARKSEGVKKAKFKSLWLSKLAKSPVAAARIDKDIAPTTDATGEPQTDGGKYVFAVPATAQVPTTGPDGTSTLTPEGAASPVPAYLCAIADEVLPKSADTCHLHMEVLFNDAADKTDAEITADPKLITQLNATLPSVEYKKDVQYGYKLILTGGVIFLELTVSPWTFVDAWDVDNLGAGTQVEGIVVGIWTLNESTDNLGQGSSGSTVAPDPSWTANPNWSAEFGAYLQAVASSGAWSGNTSAPDLGNGSASGTATPGGTWSTVNSPTFGNLGANGSGSASANGSWSAAGGNSDNLGNNGSASSNTGGNWSGNNSDSNPDMGNDSASGGSTNGGGNWGGNNPNTNTDIGKE